MCAANVFEALPQHFHLCTASQKKNEAQAIFFAKYLFTSGSYQYIF